MPPMRGYLLLTGLVFGTIFVTALGALASYVLTENRLQRLSTAEAKALAIAEAGLEYYRWHLAHYPDDLQNGTGAAGPYTLDYHDPEGGVAGTITLEIEGNASCGETTSVDITSTGAVDGAPGTARTVAARYARKSVGDYSYVLNADVWAGPDRIILGPYHSNYGVRMDGTANSPVTSSVGSWNCTSSFGCTPTQSAAPGVLGNGPNQYLWEDEVPSIPFNNISADFTALKTLAQDEGIYYPRYSSGTNTGQTQYWRGYHLVFNANGTVSVYRVGTPQQRDLWDGAANNGRINPNDTPSSSDYAAIASGGETLYETRAIPADCGLIFVEDNVWVEGTVPSKVTVVAANTGSLAPNAYIRNNIQYGATDGSDGFTLIAERNVLISPQVPDTLTLRGIFVAQDGAFGMNAYETCSYGEKDGTLTIHGTTVSNKRTGTRWGSGTSSCSYRGFDERVDAYDRELASDPPPGTPVVSDDYRFVNWREE